MMDVVAFILSASEWPLHVVLLVLGALFLCLGIGVRIPGFTLGSGFSRRSAIAVSVPFVVLAIGWVVYSQSFANPKQEPDHVFEEEVIVPMAGDDTANGIKEEATEKIKERLKVKVAYFFHRWIHIEMKINDIRIENDHVRKITYRIFRTFGTDGFFR